MTEPGARAAAQAAHEAAGFDPAAFFAAAGIEAAGGCAFPGCDPPSWIDLDRRPRRRPPLLQPVG
ncbi:hypothetical protein ACFQH9_26045 [Pseudonocardia lutea]|jgi:hypothetical protein|uniref:Ada DNA repair metal-binding domain-containing protein n=1 Tax=Pseudonocardia lutea TaxID=2172015 RepID=A0ABW1IE63_9PSEU